MNDVSSVFKSAAIESNSLLNSSYFLSVPACQIPAAHSTVADSPILHRSGSLSKTALCVILSATLHPNSLSLFCQQPKLGKHIL